MVVIRENVLPAPATIHIFPFVAIEYPVVSNEFALVTAAHTLGDCVVDWAIGDVDPDPGVPTANQQRFVVDPFNPDHTTA
jgi:hypothetical protein